MNTLGRWATSLRFRLLAAAARGGSLEPARLAALEKMDNLFPDLDLTRFL